MSNMAFWSSLVTAISWINLRAWVTRIRDSKSLSILNQNMRNEKHKSLEMEYLAEDDAQLIQSAPRFCHTRPHKFFQSHSQMLIHRCKPECPRNHLAKHWKRHANTYADHHATLANPCPHKCPYRHAANANGPSRKIHPSTPAAKERKMPSESAALMRKCGTPVCVCSLL